MHKIAQYVSLHAEEALALTCEIAQIPAPSHQEQNRAQFCVNWLKEQGIQTAYIDSIGNLVCPLKKGKSEKIVLFTAHMDTVFDLDVPLEIRKEGHRIYCPGIGDDTANLAVMLLGIRWCAEYLTENTEYGFVFAGTIAEETNGLGMKTLIDEIGAERIYRCYSFDATYQRLYSGVVNITNWLVQVNTNGGHALGNYGNPNAIEELSKILTRTAEFCHNMIKKNALTRTTFNVGTFRGGKRNNLIAEHAEMTLEFRSDEEIWCKDMESHFESIIQESKREGVEIRITRTGSFPFWSKVDQQVMKQFEEAHLKLMRNLGLEPKVSKAATDCRYPMYVGIPSLCLGLCMAGNPHNQKEYLEADSLKKGLELLLSIFDLYT